VPKLTAHFVQHVKPEPTKRIEIPDAVLPGLYLILQVSGARSWAVRYRHQGRPRKYTIGAYPAISLASAREAAREALAQVARGDDPAAVKASRRGRAIFEMVATRFIETYCRQHQKTWRETQRTLWREVVPLWRDREFGSIVRTDVNELLHDILARGAPHTSNRVLAYLRKLWNWSIDEGYVEHSPCDRVRKKAPVVKRDRVLSDAEVRLVWTAWERQGWPWGHLQKLLLVTGARLREVAEMRWDELDLDEAKFWVIPRERMKADREHSVPLTPLATEIIVSLPRFAGSPYLFPSTRARKLVPGASPAQVRAARPISGFSSGKREVDRLIAAANADTPLPSWRWHDLRRTVRSNLSRLGINRDVAEAVLGHVPQGVAAVYDRWSYGAEKREALEAWATLLQTIIDPSRKVVALRR
jgi:integrase